MDISANFYNVLCKYPPILECLRKSDIERTVRFIATGDFVPDDIFDSLRPFWSLFANADINILAKCCYERFNTNFDIRSLSHLFKNDEKSRRRNMAHMMCVLIVESGIFDVRSAAASSVPISAAASSFVPISAAASSFVPISAAASSVPISAAASSFVPNVIPIIPNAEGKIVGRPRISTPNIVSYNDILEKSMPACLAIREIITRASYEDLRLLVLHFSLHGVFSRIAFCKHNRLKNENFYKWLVDNSGQTMDSTEVDYYTSLVREFLLRVFPHKPISARYAELMITKNLKPVSITPISNSDRDFADLCKNNRHIYADFRSSITIISDTLAVENRTVADVNAIISEKQARDQTFLQKIVVSNPHPQFIIFVDADNIMFPSMCSLKRILSFYPELHLFVYLIMSPYTALNNSYISEYYNDWTHIMVTPISCKDAADAMLCTMIMQVHMCVNKSVKFLVCSDDTFAMSTVESMRYFGRSCALVDRNESVGLVMLREISPCGILQDLIILLRQISPIDGYRNTLLGRICAQNSAFEHFGRDCERYIFREVMRPAKKEVVMPSYL